MNVDRNEIYRQVNQLIYSKTLRIITEMSFQEHIGHICYNDKNFGAKLQFVNDRIYLDVYNPDKGNTDFLPEKMELLHFLSNIEYFSLLHLQCIRRKIKININSVNTYSVRFALEKGLFDKLDDVCSNRWRVYIEDIAKIYHVTGLEQYLDLTGDRSIVNLTYKQAKPVELECHHDNLVVKLEQENIWNSDEIAGPSFTFKYPAVLHLEKPINLCTALKLMHKIRLFFSLLMGRALGINEAYLDIIDEEHLGEVNIHGIRARQSSDKPYQRIVNCNCSDELAILFDHWMCRADDLTDVISLHFQGLEQYDLETALRFQLFVQAIEAAHRRMVPPVEKKIDTKLVIESLRSNGGTEETIDRIQGVLSHAHEPSLRNRLTYYWDNFKDEIHVLLPNLDKKKMISRLVETRNFYAHRMDKTRQVLEGKELWDAVELLKAISHMIILQEIKAPVAGIGKSMLDNSFVQFTIP